MNKNVTDLFSAIMQLIRDFANPVDGILRISPDAAEGHQLSWTFFDDDNNGYTDTVTALRFKGSGNIVLALWNGERGETWEPLDWVEGDEDQVTDFLDEVLAAASESAHAGIPALAQSVAKTVREAVDNAQRQARQMVRMILRSLPGHEAVSNDCLGYLFYETMGDEWVEASVHALVLHDGIIRVTTDIDYDEDVKPCVTDWFAPDREMTFTEDDHYATVNWVSVLEQLSCFISANKS